MSPHFEILTLASLAVVLFVLAATILASKMKADHPADRELEAGADSGPTAYAK